MPKEKRQTKRQAAAGARDDIEIAGLGCNRPGENCGIASGRSSAPWPDLLRGLDAHRRIFPGQALPRETTVARFRVQRKFPNLRRGIFLPDARRLNRAPKVPDMILLAPEDIIRR